MKLILIVAGILPVLTGRSQFPHPESVLEQWSARSPVEKVYLHTDRDNYFAGETAWFKVYCWSGHQPDTLSTSVFVDLLDQGGQLLTRTVVPVFFGTASGHIDIPDSLSTGICRLRAFTSLMLNHDHAFLYRKEIGVSGKKPGRPALTEAAGKRIRFEFFPEGGTLLGGVNNSIAFKVTDEKGLPVAFAGSLRGSDNEIITVIRAVHDGMGVFEFTPEPGKRYAVQPDGKSALQNYMLPEAADKGIALTMLPHPQGYFFEIRQNTNDPDFRVAFMIGQMDHQPVFRQEFRGTAGDIQGVIPTGALLSGILQVTYFNSKGMPLAERLCFVDNNEYRLAAELLADTTGFASREKNRFSLRISDTVRGHFSVSVTDPSYSVHARRQEHIISSLLLTSDLKGKVHNPAYYFSSGHDSVKTALDLLMMTQGWRRFRWDRLISGKDTAARYRDGAFISFKGRVTLRDSKRPFADKELLLLVTGAGSARISQILQTDPDGHFSVDSLVFTGSTRLFFSDTRGKKSQLIDVALAEAPLLQPFIITEMDTLVLNTLPAYDTAAWQMDYEIIQREKGILLEGVTIQVKKKSPLEELNERYTSGLFNGDAQRDIDLVNTDEPIVQENIFEYLKSRVPGLQVADPDLNAPAIPDPANPYNDPSSYRLFYRQMPTASSLGNQPMALYLDEVETHANVIATLPAGQVALIKVFSYFAAAPGGGSGGALAIYTRKGKDLDNRHRKDMLVVDGYAVRKEFYAPDYRTDTTFATGTDNRITLDWRPSIIVNSIHPRIPFSFYNNDRTRAFRVVVEGMTTDGKLLYLEKLVTPGF